MASRMGTNPSSSTYVYQLFNALNYYAGSGTYDYIGTWDTSFSMGLSSSLQDGHPVIAHTNANDYLVGYEGAASSIRHYITCYGYSKGRQGSSNTNDVSDFDSYDVFSGTTGNAPLQFLIRKSYRPKRWLLYDSILI